MKLAYLAPTLFSLAVMAGPAFSQSYAPTIPYPSKEYLVHDTVSETDASLHLDVEDASIGPRDNPGSMSFVRSYSPNMGKDPEYTDPETSYPNLFAPFGLDTHHNLQGFLTINSEYLFADNLANAQVVLFGNTYNWKDVYPKWCNGCAAPYNYVLANDGSGAALRQPGGVLTTTHVVLKNGTKIEFSNYDWHVHGYHVSKVTFPNGEVWNYSYIEKQAAHTSYSSYMLTRVQSSRGWGIKFTYGLFDPELGHIPQNPVVSRVQAYTKTCSSCSESVTSTIDYRYKMLLPATSSRAAIYALSAVVYPDGSRTEFDYSSVFSNYYRGAEFGLTKVKLNSRVIREYTYKAIGGYPNFPGLYETGLAPTIVQSSTDGRGLRTDYEIEFFTQGLLRVSKSDPLGRTSFTKSVDWRSFVNSSSMDTTQYWNKTENGWESITPFVPPPAVRPIEQVDQLGRTTSLRYSLVDKIIESKKPIGNIARTMHDLRGNVIEESSIPPTGSGESTLVKRWNYIVCDGYNYLTCNLPSHEIGPRGFRTSYEWSSIHGGLLSEQSGLDSAGGCALPGGCPLKTKSYTAFTGIDGSVFYLLTGESEKINASDSVSKTYEYDPTRGYTLKSATVSADGQTLRTCYKYDLAGNLISKTEPNANLTSCP